MRRCALVGLLAIAAVFLLIGTALATPVPRAQVGMLPGFPRVRGVQPVLANEADVKAREALVKSAFAAARSGRLRADGNTPVPNETEISLCVSEAEEAQALFTQEPCYRGGPVLRDPAIHLIFWQGPRRKGVPEEAVEEFSPAYIATIEQYFANVAHASGSVTDDFAVDSEYFSEEDGLQVPGEYALRFKTKAEVLAGEEPYSYVDATDAFPEHSKAECSGPAVDEEGEELAAAGACIFDKNLHEEVERAAAAEKWNPESVKAGSRQAASVFVVLTPPGVGGCFQKGSGECAYTAYCAYHSDFGGNGETVGKQTVYENLPYIGGVRGCEIFNVRPNKVAGADAVIDTANHETNESITDPLGSQCNEEEVKGKEKIVGCEPFSWMDEAGQEIADKCLPPETPFGGIYGEPLGTLEPDRRPAEEEEGFYNELISGGHYWTQRIWSLTATAEGGCVQRIVPTSFPEPDGAAATVPTTFSGSRSGEPADPVIYWSWSFGDGTQAAAPSSTISHTYAEPGSYLVTLTAYDAYGNSHAFTREIHVGNAPPPTTTTTNTTTVTTTAAIVHRTPAQLAKLLGLPANGAKLAGGGAILLGHAQCPPACSLRGRLLAAIHEGNRVKRVQVGSLQEQVAKNGTGGLAIKLTAQGRKLLKSDHELSVVLVLSVEEASGAKWTIERKLTLTDGGKAAQYSSHAARRARR